MGMALENSIDLVENQLIIIALKTGDKNLLVTINKKVVLQVLPI